jgi:hypothetical protein
MIVSAAGNVNAKPTVEEDRKAVADLDTQYQAAVERNDFETMARIHTDDMTLVVSSGAVITGKTLEQRAREKFATYERQVEVDNSQVVRVHGRYRRGDCEALDQGHPGEGRDRLQAVVQRHVRPHTHRLALLLRAGRGATEGVTRAFS